MKQKLFELFKKVYNNHIHIFCVLEVFLQALAAQLLYERSVLQLKIAVWEKILVFMPSINLIKIALHFCLALMNNNFLVLVDHMLDNWRAKIQSETNVPSLLTAMQY